MDDVTRNIRIKMLAAALAPVGLTIDEVIFMIRDIGPDPAEAKPEPKPKAKPKAKGK